MNRILAALAVTAAVVTGSAAQGAVIVTSVNGPSLAFSFEGAVAGSTYITFQDVSLGTTGAFTSNGFDFSGDGMVRWLTTPQALMPALDFTK
jgi:hypothetical protein